MTVIKISCCSSAHPSQQPRQCSVPGSSSGDSCAQPVSLYSFSLSLFRLWQFGPASRLMSSFRTHPSEKLKWIPLFWGRAAARLLTAAGEMNSSRAPLPLPCHASGIILMLPLDRLNINNKVALGGREAFQATNC